MNDSTTEAPLLAIRCLVYNHEPYLRQCLDGFVMQRTTFPFIAVVHDDASTDGSAAIIREYEEKYPHIIKPIYQTENQYSKHDGSIGRAIDACIPPGVKYIAMCEGDDYWIDPDKLQIQVDFLEAHPEYAICCHDTKMWNERTKVMTDHMVIPEAPEDGTIYDLAKGNYIINLSVVYRNIPEIRNRPIVRTMMGDYVNHMRHAEYGKIKYIPRVMGVYRAGCGVWSSLSDVKGAQKEIEAAVELMKCYREDKQVFLSLCELLYRRTNHLASIASTAQQNLDTIHHTFYYKVGRMFHKAIMKLKK